MMTVVTMKVIGTTDDGMGLAEQSLPITIFLKEAMTWIRGMDMECISGMTEGSTQDSSSRTRGKGEAPTHGRMAPSTKVNSKLATVMVKECIVLQMDPSTLESGKVESTTELASAVGLMEEAIAENGRKDVPMAME